MNPFEQNSIHLNGAGYKFGIAKLQGAVTQSLTGFSLIEVAPMWVNTDKTTDQMLYAIMGSEPKIGENKEVGIPQIEVKKIIYAEPVKI